MEKKEVIVAPSLLAANFLQLQHDIDMVNNSEAAWLHLDVMDGRFVPNISYGMPIIAQVSQACTKVADVHLMIEQPDLYIADFKKAGAQVITVHQEACTHLHRTIQLIHSLDMKAGVALNPATPVHTLEDIIADIDLVLIMSVNPGFGGQKFIQHTIKKIMQARELIDRTGSRALIEVDGGINLENAHAIVQAGADVLVAGSTVFASSNPVQTIAQLKQAGK
ncbi:ribulose-phosphate 3-epimerase [Chitinophaga skermanii]|uniref:ribulose-phosphate 3-epimerase n=1 Tax=Chitinophaga skermanii TaxID=331697 RepID=UPI001FEB6BF0|nr:ribulose-phosphate 3-epimerase [Chitinophaga skermanii]